MVRTWRTLGFAVVWLSVSVASAQVTLEFKRDPATKVRYKTSIHTNQVLTLNGTPIATVSDHTSTVAAGYTAPAENGDVAVQMTTEAVAAQAQLPGGLSFQFDSAANIATTNVPQLEVYLDVIRAVQGSTLTFRISRDRKVVGVDGIQAIIRQAPQAAASLLEKELSSDRLTSDMQQEIDQIPAQALNVADAWERTEVWHLGSGQTLTFDRRFEYTGTAQESGKTVDQIKVADLKVRYAIVPDPAQPLSVKNSDLAIDSSTGVIVFDRELGDVVRRELTTHIKGKLTLVANGMDIPGELDLTVTRNVQRLE